MRKILTILLFLPISLMAQRHYDTCLVEGRTWVYDYHHFDIIDEALFQYTETVKKLYYTIKGDTTFNGVSYRKVYKQWEDGKPGYCMAYREEGSTVYMYTSKYGESVEMELETSRFINTQAHYLRKYTDVIDSIIVNGRRFCRHKYYEYENDQNPIIAVEGIGFHWNGLIGAINYMRPTCTCDYQIFHECLENGEVIIRNSDFDAPTATGIDLSTASSLRSQGMLFDLQGRRIQEPHQKGIYIRDGKKVVVR